MTECAPICYGEMKCTCPRCRASNRKLEGPGAKSGLSLREPLGKPLGNATTHHGLPQTTSDYCPPAIDRGENE